MVMKKIGAVLKGPTPGADGYPIRRGSRLAGTCEGAFWHPMTKVHARRIVLAAKRYELVGRQAGRRRGPLGHVGLEVIEFMANLMTHRTGRLEPAISYLMIKLKRSKAAVTRALAALREHGFLDWVRRHEKVAEVVEGPGPRVRQVSNAYGLSLPARAARLLRRFLSPPPLPDDLAQEREEQAAWVREHKAGLPLSELPLAEVGDDRLARALGDLGRAIEAKAKAARAALGAPGAEGQERGGEACA